MKFESFGSSAADHAGAVSGHNTVGAEGLPPQLLLSMVFRPEKHVHFTTTMQSGFRLSVVRGVAQAVRNAIQASGDGHDCYFGCAAFKTSGSRKADNAIGAFCMWGDVDVGSDKQARGKGYATVSDAYDALDRFCDETGVPTPTHLVESGGGLHYYWGFQDLVVADVWKATAEKLKAVMTARGFLVDASRATDMASLLRIPGTLNYKRPVPRPVRLVRAEEPVDADDFLQAIDAAYEAHVIPLEAKVLRTVEADDFSGSFGDAGGSDFESVRLLVNQIDPDVEYGDWIAALMGIYHETGGSEQGLHLALSWSRRGRKFRGDSDVKVHWRSFRRSARRPITIGTLHMLARDKGERFENVPTEVVIRPIWTSDRALCKEANRALNEHHHDQQQAREWTPADVL